MKKETMCFCGRPLHYTSAEVRLLIEEMVARYGDDVVVTIQGRSWSVPRHYIALHGLKAEDVPSIGFPEVI